MFQPNSGRISSNILTPLVTLHYHLAPHFLLVFLNILNRFLCHSPTRPVSCTKRAFRFFLALFQPSLVFQSSTWKKTSLWYRTTLMYHLPFARAFAHVCFKEISRLSLFSSCCQLLLALLALSSCSLCMARLVSPSNDPREHQSQNFFLARAFGFMILFCYPMCFCAHYLNCVCTAEAGFSFSLQENL